MDGIGLWVGADVCVCLYVYRMLCGGWVVQWLGCLDGC